MSTRQSNLTKVGGLGGTISVILRSVTPFPMPEYEINPSSLEATPVIQDYTKRSQIYVTTGEAAFAND